MSAPQPLPESLRLLADEYRRAAGPAGDCLKCSGACCDVSGPAAAANVLQICERYSRGWLSRQFEPGLEPRDFVVKYFDIVQVTPAEAPTVRPFQVFFPRSLVGGQVLICISPVQERTGAVRPLTLREYLMVREHHREATPGQRWSCIFRSADLPAPDGSGRAFTGCMLHDDQSATHLAAKPIGCALQVCNAPPTLVEPEPGLYRRWLEELGGL